jgi:hypothetical protein
MTSKDAREAGRKHAELGLKNTPYDCKEFDKKLFELVKNEARPSKSYAKLRGAFNKGWEEKYFEMVSE